VIARCRLPLTACTAVTKITKVGFPAGTLINDTGTMNTIEPIPQKQPMSPGKIALLLFFSILLALLMGAAIVYFYLFPSPFTPVTLKADEQQVLDEKIHRITQPAALSSPQSPASTRTEPLQPEAYVEPNQRSLQFSEREINAMLAHNTNLADKLAIDLSDQMISAKLLIPLEPDFPILGGKTVRVNAGVAIDYRQQPNVTIVGISVFGVPLPNEWLGNLKGTNLIDQLEHDNGFWRQFFAGIETMQVSDGSLSITLKE